MNNRKHDRQEEDPTGLTPATIPGLLYIPEYIDRAHHDHLVEVIDAEPWFADLKRRTQHYGWKYDYKKHRIDRSLYLGSLPPWAAEIAEKLYHDRLVPQLPDQCIANEYEPGQGITPHVDCEPCFKDGIVSLSLGSTCIMEFSPTKGRGPKLAILLEPRSIIVLTGPARYDWRHAIPARKADPYDGHLLPRSRRISLTFRTVLLNETGKP